MRIILLHNYYRNTAGEDVVFKQETELLKQNGHVVECIEFSNAIINSPLKTIIYFFKSIYNPSSASLLKKRIRVFKPDIIHVHNAFLVASPSIYRVAKKFNIPLVQTLHNYRMICPSVYLYFKGEIYSESINKIFPIKAVLKGVYKSSIPYTFLVAFISTVHKILGTYKNSISKFISLNEFSRDIFLKSSLKVQESQIVVKPNFIIDPGFKSVQKGDFFIYVGRLSPEKGIKTLLHAFKNSNKKLHIIGDGELKPMVESFANENLNIEYLGFQNRQEIMEKLRKAKALIFPSEWYETFGLTIIEAFACSTPVIISDIGGHSKMVEEGRTGFHFKSGNSYDLELALNKFEEIADKEKLGINARNEFELNYTAEKNYQNLISIYKSLLN